VVKVGQAATQLCRLAFSLANQTDVVAAATLALDGLFEGTSVEAGAVFIDRKKTTPPVPSGLEVIAAIISASVVATTSEFGVPPTRKVVSSARLRIMFLLC
jgi:hypothetical protein